MRRSRAFILSEQLLAIILQAGFILVLCMSFYGLTSFYAGSQQVLTARNHAERVISFMDNRVRNAGLGLWKCESSDAIADKLSIPILKRDGTPERYYRLPVSLKWDSNNMSDTSPNDRPLASLNQDSGDVLTLLYAQRDLSTGDEENISVFQSTTRLNPMNYFVSGAYRNGVEGTILLLDNSFANRSRLANAQSVARHPQKELLSLRSFLQAWVVVPLLSTAQKVVSSDALCISMQHSSLSTSSMPQPSCHRAACQMK